MRHLLVKLYWGGTILRGRLEGCASSAIELMASFELSETLSWRDNERHLRRIRDFLPVPYRLHPWLPERDLFRSIGIIGWKRERENWKPHPSRSNLPAGYNCKQQDGEITSAIRSLLAAKNFRRMRRHLHRLKKQKKNFHLQKIIHIFGNSTELIYLLLLV